MSNKERRSCRSPLVLNLPLKERCNYSPLMVLESPSGWYIGTIYTDPNDLIQEPGTRDSVEIFPNRETAMEALLNDNWKQRTSIE